MNCLTDTLGADIVNDCKHISIAGIESDAVVIPLKDIDKTATTFDPANDLVVTDLVLKAGATGYVIEGFKQTHGYNWDFVPSEETLDKYRHVFAGLVMTPNSANRLSLSKLAKGEAYAVVVHKRYKGDAGKDAFMLLGYDNGMYVTEMTENSKESDAAIKFTLSSKDDTLELDMPRTVLETDHTTTLAAFNNKFVSA